MLQTNTTKNRMCPGAWTSQDILVDSQHGTIILLATLSVVVVVVVGQVKQAQPTN